MVDDETLALFTRHGRGSAMLWGHTMHGMKESYGASRSSGSFRRVLLAP